LNPPSISAKPLFLDSGDAETTVELADALIASGDPLAAVEALQPLLRRAPELTPGQLALGRAWLELGERQKAITALHRCLDAGPADPSAVQALIDRIEGDPTETMSQAYVRALFDRYAERFDEDLTIRLKYQAPQVLRALVDQLPGIVPGGMDVLDVGCGTGLAGVAFRSLAKRLHGSDLAPRMVEKARRRDVYDHLEVAELVEGTARTPLAWDLVVAADVLVYVGDLAPVMDATRVGLRPGGFFCATVEQCAGDGFILGPSRRYAHSAAYIRRVATEAGLDLIVLEEAVPRWEKGIPCPASHSRSGCRDVELRRSVYSEAAADKPARRCRLPLRYRPTYVCVEPMRDIQIIRISGSFSPSTCQWALRRPASSKVSDSQFRALI
jgi:predicted TPR repeat methyltransferase